jgi:hypothetical protein
MNFEKYKIIEKNQRNFVVSFSGSVIGSAFDLDNALQCVWLHSGKPDTWLDFSDGEVVIADKLINKKGE